MSAVNPYEGMFSRLPQGTPGSGMQQPQEVMECAVCGDTGEFRWPECQHPFCAGCVIHHARARRMQHIGLGERLPPVETMRTLPCPYCRRGFGSSSESIGAYQMLQDAASSLDLTAWAQPAVAGGDQGAVVLPQPGPPEGMFCLCHQQVGGPPDFRPLFERRMHWAPTAHRECHGLEGGVGLQFLW